MRTRADGIKRRPSCNAGLAFTALVVLATACGGSSPDSDAADEPVHETHVVTGAPSAGCRAATPHAPESERRTLQVSGATRSYVLTRPAATADDAPSPLVVLFHGAGANAEAFSDVTRLPAKGMAAGVTVAAPEGVDHNWQFDGYGTDAEFVDAMLADIARTTCVDEQRVVVSGFSAGALFGIAYACARADRIAAVVTVAAEPPTGCTDALPIMAFHGTSDATIPYGDAAAAAPAAGTKANMAVWAAINGCGSEPTVETIGSEVVRHVWTGCRRGDVVLYEIAGGGHTWPGSDVTKVPDFVLAESGLTTAQVDATERALAFAAHPYVAARESEARVARADDSRTVMVGTDTVHCIATAAQTGGSYSFLEIEIPAGSGPPPHEHVSDEWFYVLSGTVVIETADQRYELTPGDYFHLPRNTQHSVKATTAVQLLAGYAPAGEEERLFCPR